MEPKVSDFLWSKVPPKQIVNNLILPFYKLLFNQELISSFRGNAKFDIGSKRLPNYGHLHGLNIITIWFKPTLPYTKTPVGWEMA